VQEVKNVGDGKLIASVRDKDGPAAAIRQPS
jgi:hypothetical protein